MTVTYKDWLLFNVPGYQFSWMFNLIFLSVIDILQKVEILSHDLDCLF